MSKRRSVKKRVSRLKQTKRTKKDSKEGFKCARCYRHFPTRRGLKLHSKRHLRALGEIKMLERGETPKFSKLGQEFKGKNKIIVS